jgi:MarR family transcriptional regulator for hemolysin
MIRRLSFSVVEERLGKTLGIAAKLCREHFDQGLREAGSSFHSYMVLRHAESYPDLNQRQLAERLGIEGPTLVRHIDRLVAEGLVQRVRDGDDRRVSRVELTAAGKDHLDRISEHADVMDSEFRGLFSPVELDTMYLLLHRIIDRYTKEACVQHRVG